jgi:hypothetical protein
MKRLSLTFVIATLTGCSAASGPAQQSAPPSDTAEGATGPRVRARSLEDDGDVQRFLDARYQASDVRHSFRSSGGQDIDCIDFFAQPGVKALGAKGRAITSIPETPHIPAELQSLVASSGTARDAHEAPVAFAGDLDPNGSVRACPEGTVPQVRITVEQVQHAGGVDAFRQRVHQKTAPPKRMKTAPPDELLGYCGPDNDGYAHVYGQLITPYTAAVSAGSSTMAIYEPSVPLYSPADFTTYSHSLSQTWTIGYNDSELLQTIEVGWNVDEWLYDTDQPTGQTHLFIYSTADGYVLSGCYNDWDWTTDCGAVDDAGNCTEPGTCVPWVQVSKTYVPGMTLPVSTVGRVNPRQPSSLPKELTLTTLQIEGNWWILIQVSGELPSVLGYYSGSQINAFMNTFELGGEVSSGTGTFMSTSMGSGQPPSEGQGFAAYHRNYFAYVPGIGEDAGSPIVDDAYVCSTVTSGYTYSATPAPVVQDGPWVNYFYYGGDPTSPILPSDGD